MLVACARVYFVYCLLSVHFKLLSQTVMIDLCGSLFTFFFFPRKGKAMLHFCKCCILRGVINCVNYCAGTVLWWFKI